MNVLKSVKLLTIFIMAFLYIFIGIKHFLDPAFFLKIMPPYIPFHLFFVYISGVFEILLGLGLLFEKTRKYAAYGLIALLVLVFPANIHLYFNPEILEATQQAALIRMFFQLPLIFIAYWHSLSSEKKEFSIIGIIIFIPTLIYFITL